MELENEINEVFENMSISDISSDIIENMEPGAIVLFCSTIIATMSENLAQYEMGKDGADPAIVQSLAAMIRFSSTISSLIPEKYYGQAMQGLKHFDAALNTIRED